MCGRLGFVRALGTLSARMRGELQTILPYPILDPGSAPAVSADAPAIASSKLSYKQFVDVKVRKRGELQIAVWERRAASLEEQGAAAFAAQPKVRLTR